MFNSNGIYPIFYNLMDFDNNEKIEHDSYDVYVNKDYVGRKILLTQNESLKDISGYLKRQGFNNFSTEVQGNHVIIKSEGAEADAIKRNLNVYLHIR